MCCWMPWWRGRGAKPSRILLRHQHFEQLAPAREQGIEQPGGRVGQRPRRGAHPLGKQGQDRRIDLIGLGKLARGAGEIPDLARVRVNVTARWRLLPPRRP